MSASTQSANGSGVIRSLVPARMDRLPWARFHWLVVVALGVTWILDGLEIQLAASIGNHLTKPDVMGFTTTEVGWTSGVYLFGEVVGALFFGRLADRFGRRKLFIVTLGLYLVANGLTGFAFDFWSYLFFRFFAGMGIGGEYAAIHSAIDELIPAKYRGRVDLGISGTYWFGAALGAGAQIFLLSPDRVAGAISWMTSFVDFNPQQVATDIGWRFAFFIGPLIGIAIWGLRKYIPESPRWMLNNGQAAEAERTVTDIERSVQSQGIELPPVDERHAIEVRPRREATYGEVARIIFKNYRTRSILGLTLMITQSVLYNAIFFSVALVLGNFYGIADADIGYYFFPFCLGNLVGPLVLGKLFDTIGRRKLISSTYIISGGLLAISAWTFQAGLLTATTQTVFWCVIFFFASAGASSAYLTVSEIFPLELRGQAIALFFAVAQLFGACMPPLFSALIGDGKSALPLTLGYLFGAALMIVGGLVAWAIGVDAEGKSLEEIAAPLSTVQGALNEGNSGGRGVGPTSPAVS